MKGNEGFIIFLLSVMICINGMIYYKLYKIDDRMQYYSGIAQDAKTVVVGGALDKVALVKDKAQKLYNLFKKNE
jgi:hypothetical protein